MVRVNFLYVALALLAVVLVLFVVLTNARSEHKEMLASYKDTEKIVQNILLLRAEVESQNIKNQTQNIIKSTNGKLTATKQSNLLKLSAKELDSQTLAAVSRKFLQSQAEIKKLEIIKNSEFEASFYLEIAE